MNTRQAILAALKADDEIVDRLGKYKTVNASIHFDRPAPEGAETPICFVSPATSVLDQDKIRTLMPIETFMVSFYGNKVDEIEAVEELGDLAKDLFHRKPGVLDIAGRQVIMIRAAGPVEAPGSNDDTIGRVVTLTIQTKVLS